MKRKLVKTLAMALALVFLFSSIAFAIPNQKEAIVLSPETIKQLKINATKQGIDEVTQDKLIARLQKGEMLDCMDPVKVAEATRTLSVSRENPRDEYVFADGSKFVIEILEIRDVDNGEKSISPMSQYTYNVNPSAGTFLYNANFWANMTRYDGYYDVINSLGAWDIYSALGTWTKTGFSITKSQENQYGPATARLSWKHVYNGYTYSDWLQLNVGNDTWWETHQL